MLTAPNPLGGQALGHARQMATKLLEAPRLALAEHSPLGDPLKAERQLDDV